MNDLAHKNVSEIRKGLLEAISHWGWQEKIRHDPELQADFVSTTYLKHNGDCPGSGTKNFLDVRRDGVSQALDDSGFESARSRRP